MTSRTALTYRRRRVLVECCASLPSCRASSSLMRFFDQSRSRTSSPRSRRSDSSITSLSPFPWRAARTLTIRIRSASSVRVVRTLGIFASYHQDAVKGAVAAHILMSNCEYHSSGQYTAVEYIRVDYAVLGFQHVQKVDVGPCWIKSPVTCPRPRVAKESVLPLTSCHAGASMVDSDDSVSDVKSPAADMALGCRCDRGGAGHHCRTRLDRLAGDRQHRRTRASTHGKRPLQLLRLGQHPPCIRRRACGASVYARPPELPQWNRQRKWERTDV